MRIGRLALGFARVIAVAIPLLGISPAAFAQRVLTLTSPVGGEVWASGNHNITWSQTGTGWTGSDTLLIECSANAGGSWTQLASGALSSTGSYTWDVTGLTPTVQYRVRVTCEQDAAATSTGNNFRVGSNINFYINDGATTDDVYCTTVGSGANDGLSPATPKGSIQVVLDNYDLEGGDTIYVDTGVYVLTANITVAAADAGGVGNLVKLVGSTHPTGSLINRNSPGVNTTISAGANYTRIENLGVTGAATGIAVAGIGMEVTGCHVYGNTTGIDITSGIGTVTKVYKNRVDSNGTGVRYGTLYGDVYQNLIVNNTGRGIWINSSLVSINNNTIAGNGLAGIYVSLGASGPVKNNIIVSQGAGTDCLWFSANYVPGGSWDYNDYLATNGASTGDSNSVNYPTLGEWQAHVNQEHNSISADPLFVDTASGDYHLSSTGGSWHGGAFTGDVVSSPCIDTGDPAGAFTSESSPNGGRINMGAYGGTSEASRSPLERALYVVDPAPGAVWASGNQTIRWHRVGQGWTGSEVLRVEVSSDDGVTWAQLTATVSASALTFPWNVDSAVPSAVYRVRVTCIGDATATSTSGQFRIGTLSFYVNDGSTANDVYCTSAGSAVANGLTAATPQSSLQTIFNTYNLEPGDRVYVDTGTYVLTSDITIGALDSGAIGNPVSISGTTNVNGSLLNRNNLAGIGISVSAPYVKLERLRVTGADRGISLTSTATGNEISVCVIYGNTNGIVLSSNSSIANNIIRNNSWGLWLTSTSGAILNNTFVSNVNGLLSSTGTLSSGLRFVNNLVWASGASAYAVNFNAGGPGSATWSYNDLYTTGGARVGYYGGSRVTLADWQTATGKDSFSISSDPLFEDSANNDYHLRPTSPCINSGTNENAPLTDFEGNLRPYNLITDIGADEGTAPSVPVVSVGPAAPTTLDDLICTVTTPSVVSVGLTPEYEYSWSNGVDSVIHGPTTSTSDSLSAIFTSKNEMWTCTVRGYDGFNFSDPVSGSTSVVNTAPGPLSLSVPVVESDAANLRCFMEKSSDPDGDVLYSIQWYVRHDGEPSASPWAGGVITTATFTQIDAADTQPGDVWHCDVTYGDGEVPDATVASSNCLIVSGGITASYIQLSFSGSNLITLGQSLTLIGRILPKPVDPDKRVFFYSDPPTGGQILFPEDVAYNPATGEFSRTFTPTEASEDGAGWSTFAHWNGDSIYSGADSATTTFTVLKVTPTLTVSLSHSSAPVGFNGLEATVTFNAALPPALAGLKEGKAIDVFMKRPDGSSAGPVSGTTNAQGIAVIDFAAKNFTFDQAGTWQFIAEFDGDSNFNAATSVNFDKPETPRLTIKDGAGYAVLIVGALDDQFAGLGEGQVEHTKTMDFVYRALIDRGLGTDDIYYLRETPAVPLPAGMTLVNDIDDATPSKAEFLAALTVWAKGKMDTAPGPLYVVMIDHGLPDKFYIYSGSLAASSRILTPTELNTSLSTLQNGFTNPAAADQDIVIINGSCNSGSFIEELSGADRTIITSAKGDEKSHRGPLDPVDNKRDGELFVRLLFQNLAGGKNLHDAFAEASANLNEFTRSRANGADPNAELPQEPLLDDNGDGEGSTAAQLSNEFAGAKAEGAESGLDGFDAFAITLGFGANAGDSVGWVTASQTISLTPAQAVPQLFARATDQPAVGHSAWIEVKQPSYTSSTAADTGNSQSNNPDEILDNFQQFVNLAVFDSPTVNPADGEYKWTGALVQRGGGQTLTQVLTQAGTYQVYYFVRDGATGETSSHLITTIYRQSAGNLPPSHVSLTYPADGATTLTTTLLAWSPSVDPNGHAVTYRVELAQDAGFTTGLIALGGLSERFVVVNPSDGILDGQTYYWRVIPVDQFGAEPSVSGAQVRTFHTDNDNTTTPGNIIGAVVDALTGLPVPGVNVAVAGPTPKTVSTLNDGVYQATKLTAGAYQVTFSKTGYKGQVVNVPVLAGQVAAVNRQLEPDSAGFLWGDVSADAKAGVLDAAFIAQWQALMRTTFPIDPAIVKPLFPDGADVNGDNALGTLDISEILKKVVRISDRFPADTNGDGRGPDAKSLEAKALAKATERLLELPANVTGNPGDVILVPITIDDAAGVLGFTFKVDFDAALLEPLGDQSERGEVAADFETFLVNDASDGSIVVVGAGSTAAEGSGTLVTLAFRVRDTAGPNIASALTFDAASSTLNDGPISVASVP